MSKLRSKWGRMHPKAQMWTISIIGYMILATISIIGSIRNAPPYVEPTPVPTQGPMAIALIQNKSPLTVIISPTEYLVVLAPGDSYRLGAISRLDADPDFVTVWVGYGRNTFDKFIVTGGEYYYGCFTLKVTKSSEGYLVGLDHRPACP